MKQSEKWKRGLPYVGNKGQNAEKIIDILPAGNRLIDVFGGGGSISLTAASSLPHTEVAFNLGKKLSFQAKGKRPDELLLKYVK